MVHLSQCLQYKRYCFNYNSKTILEDEIQGTPEKDQKKRKTTQNESPKIVESPVVNYDDGCILPLSHPQHKKNKISSITQGSLIFNFGKDKITLCQFGHLEGNGKDVVKKEVDKYADFRSNIIEGKSGFECCYKTCKKSDVEGVQLTGGEISVCSAVDPVIKVYIFCSADCLWKHMIHLAKSTFTNEFSKKSKQIEKEKAKKNRE